MFCILTLLAAITMPVLIKTRQKARTLKTMNNLRLIVIGVSCFATDNDGRYPPSVATIGVGQNWNWQEPTILTASKVRDNQFYRSTSAYLRSYINNPSIMFCPNAPRQYEHLQNMWEAAEQWDNPETMTSHDPVIGTYCFYWNYTGLLSEQKSHFTGPTGVSRQSRLLVSDYFGYGHWRNKNIYGNCNAYGSCERFRFANVTPGTVVSSDFWSLPAEKENLNLNTLRIKLHAGYTDGHVESYSPSETVPMKVIKNISTGEPYDYGPSLFYLPVNAIN